MQTDVLIHVLASGLEPTPPGVARWRLLLALIGSMPVAITAMMLTLGVQPALTRVLALPMFWVKLALALALIGAGALALSRLGRPGASLGRVPVLIAIPCVLVWALALLVLLRAAPEARDALLLGDTWLVCPWLIAALSLPSFVAAVWALRGLAPTRLRLTGAAAGLFAGAVGASAYAFHCPEFAAPFIGIWYVLGMAVPTLIGAAVGDRLLRWG